LQHEIEEKAIITIARWQPMAVEPRQSGPGLREELRACGR
jgi:hypothetical protein